eukprot:1196043-Prorocentrum_minimum.AAC.4
MPRAVDLLPPTIRMADQHGRGVPREPQLPIGATRPPARKGRCPLLPPPDPTLAPPWTLPSRSDPGRAAGRPPDDILTCTLTFY